MAILRPLEKVSGQFLRELIMTPDIHHRFERKANGASRFGLTLNSIRSTKLPLPDRQMQDETTEVFKNNSIIVSLLSEYIEQLQQQKKGLMQKLLTGQVRVNV